MRKSKIVEPINKVSLLINHNKDKQIVLDILIKQIEKGTKKTINEPINQNETDLN